MQASTILETETNHSLCLFKWIIKILLTLEIIKSFKSGLKKQDLAQRSWDPPSARKCLYLVFSFLSLQLRIRMAFSAAHYAFGEREFELIASSCVSSSWAFKSNIQRVIPELYIFPCCGLPVGRFRCSFFCVRLSVCSIHVHSQYLWGVIEGPHLIHL